MDALRAQWSRIRERAFGVPVNGTSGMVSLLAGVVVMGRSAHRAIAGYVRVGATVEALAIRHHAWVQAVEVIPLDFPFRPAAAAVEPVVWQDEHGAVVIFETDVATPEHRAILRFEGLLQSKFGYPNDEALSGHPYWQHGLGFYGVFEIKGSKWLEELATQNRVAFPDGTWPRRPYRHFVLTLHDSTFEALCMNVGGRATDDTVAELVSRLVASERA